MPAIEINGGNVEYEFLGDPGAAVIVVTPGGRFSKDVPGVRSFAQALADVPCIIAGGSGGARDSTSHQVLGAVGLCDEHDLTIITLSLQARLRLPLDLEASMAALARAVETSGYDSLFTPTERAPVG